MINLSGQQVSSFKIENNHQDDCLSTLLYANEVNKNFMSIRVKVCQFMCYC
jgi:hypothetical protein